MLNSIQCSDEPLILCFWTGNTDEKGKHSEVGHTVVTRTDKKPEITKEGWYRVYIYDPNTPYLCFIAAPLNCEKKA